MLEKIKVYLMTYNRPDLVVNSAKSIISQTYSNFELIISDNSTDCSTRVVLEESGILDNPNVFYKKRQELNGLYHIKLILAEVTEKYFMIFHDDDLMLPEMLMRLHDEIVKKENVNISAVGCNAFIMKNNVLSKSVYMDIKDTSQRVMKVDAPWKMVIKYLNDNICPFDSYLYNNNVIKGIMIDELKGGKYSDCSFILDINRFGIVKLITEPLMVLRQHPEQDSKDHSLIDRIRLINYMKRISINEIAKVEFKKAQIYNIYAQYRKNILTGRNRYISKKTLKISIILIKTFKIKLCMKLHLKSIVNYFRSCP